MAKTLKPILTTFYVVTTLLLAPFFILIYFCYRDKIKCHLIPEPGGIFKCDVYDNISLLKETLFLAEDHRFNYHYGFDLIAITRATYIYVTQRKLEGASTIQQQLVRTISGRYEISLKRKIIEITSSFILTLKKDKDYIAEKYLEVAFYGSNLKNIDDAMYKLSRIYEISIHDRDLYFAIIASLKYPIPLKIDRKWFIKHKNRVNHIRSLFIGSRVER